MEMLYWLSKSPNPYADTRPVMVDAKASTILTYQQRAARGVTGTNTGPSKQKTNFEEQMAAVASGEGLKVIPRNYLEISNANTHSKLKEALKIAGLPRHDAMMPEKLAEFFIKFLTRTKDLVYDPFHGSGTTAKKAEELERRWVGSDRSLAHLLGSAIRIGGAQFEPA
jgi:site-specific DNA-methyltransferase (cytosine-N4-specific)